MKGVIEKTSLELKKFQEIERTLEKEGRVILFLGDKHHNYYLYLYLSLEFPSLNFYHIFNKRLIHKMFRKFTSKIYHKSEEYMAVLKKKEFTDETEPEQLVTFEHLLSMEESKNFIISEMHPKFRNSSYAQ